VSAATTAAAPAKRPVLAMYGAGNIGRGFLGAVFADAGYEVAFIDVAADVVAALNRDGRYPLAVVSDEARTDRWVEGVRAVDGRDAEAVADLIATCDAAATAVGVNVLPRIAPLLAKGIARRMEATPARLLDLIIAENLIDANLRLAEWVSEYLPEPLRPRLSAEVGFVEASIGRMVPVMTEAMKEGNLLRVWVEPYDELPVDRDAFRGPIPPVPNLRPSSPFEFYIRRKLFVHNLGHATTAYFGWPRRCALIADAVRVPEVEAAARAAMGESSRALSAEFGVTPGELAAHVDDLLFRFRNRSLGDTVARVGRDPLRKLSPDDRMVGAARLCLKHGIEPDAIARAIAAGLGFDDPSDPSAAAMQAEIREKGAEAFLARHCGLGDDPADEAGRRIRAKVLAALA
jgi:mannitol-1-phosphate 5-dehydrogenase